MTTAVQRRRGTAAQHATFTGVLAEFTYDTDDKRIVAHDGVTAGGIPMAKESEIAGLAPIANPTFTGVPAAPTAAALTNTTQIATTAFVQQEITALVGGAPGALNTLDELAAALGDDANFATTVTNNLALKAPLASPTFTGTPAAPTPSPGDNDTSIATTAFVTAAVAAASGAGASVRNRDVNPAFQISQENGNTSGTTNMFYPADQWWVSRVTSAGTITAQRVQSTTPGGAKDRIRITITAADASLAAGEFLSCGTNIEGNEVADFRYGSASAKQSVRRFGFKGPQGTYAFRRTNKLTNRSFVSLFTISAPNANVDTVQTIVITGDTSGTWENGAELGFTDEIVLACGSTFQGTTGWQAGNILGTSGVSNGMGTISAVFEIFDVGLYADFASTGAAPTGELPDYDQTERQCQRYYWKVRAAGVDTAGVMGTGNSTSDTFIGILTPPVTMRATPALVASAATTFGVVYGSANLTGTTGPTLSQANASFARIDLVHADLTLNAACGFLYFNAANAYIGLNARM